jgi:hypothetical protein
MPSNFSNPDDQPWALNRSTITTVTIALGVLSIGNYAFAECSALTSVNIPAGVYIIGNLAFADCSSLTSITVDDSNTTYSDDDGVLFNEAQTTLIQYPAKKPGNSYTVPSTVSTIGPAAFFHCTGLKSVTLPASVSVIEDYAFEGCTGLTDITVNWALSTNIPDISGKDVFYDVIPGSVTLYIANGTGKSDYTAQGWPSDFHYIGCSSGTFGATGGLTWTLCGGTLTIDGTGAMDDFANYTLQPWALNRDDITDIIIEEGVTSIGDFAFNGCDNLVSVSIPASVGTIGKSAFATCEKLETVNFAPLSLLTDIGTYAFSSCSVLESIDIPSSVTSIGEGAFVACGFESVTIPASVETVGVSAFAMCTKLETVNFAPSSLLTVI